jgi:hypothetical protein
MTKEAGQAIIKSFDLTFVLYEEGNYLSFLFGTAALSPILLGAMFGTLVLFNRHIQVRKYCTDLTLVGRVCWSWLFTKRSNKSSAEKNNQRSETGLTDTKSICKKSWCC